ncbi:hypothetical protein PENSPDRAFT_731933 [Peniophora sp. CONT]|nr:hypothetical protein PENSPDRAFT_731933 [Peniophora sp. CONT]
MSFLAIRSKWKAKSKAVSRRLAQAPTPGSSREHPPPSAVSTESFESPFVVEIGSSPNPDKSPQVDLELSTEPLFPSGLWARPGSVSNGSQNHLYNPWEPQSRNGAEEMVIVGGDAAEQDDPHAWIDEPEPHPEASSSSWAKRGGKSAPTPLVIPNGKQSRRGSRRGGQRSAHDDDASVISGITLPGALIGNSFSVGGAEQSARFDGRLSRRITRIDSATLPRGDHPLLHQPVTRRSSLPEFEPDEDAPPVPPLPQALSRPDSGIYPSSSTKSSRRGSRQLLPPETPPIATAHRASQRLQPAEGHAPHRISRISEASTPSAISPAISSLTPDTREASDREIALANSLSRLSRKRSASSASKPMYESSLRQRSSRSVQSLLLHPDKFHSKPSTSSLPSTADEPDFSGLPSAAIIGRTDSFARLPAFPETAHLPETAGQLVTQLPGVSPDSPEPSAPPFTPDLLDGVLSSAVPSTALQTPGLRYPETPSDLAPTSSSPGVSRASSVTRSSMRPSRRGSTRKSKLLPRPVSAKPSAASVRDSIARRRRSRARSQSRGPGHSPRTPAPPPVALPPVSLMPVHVTPLPNPRAHSELFAPAHARTASGESVGSGMRGRTPPPRLIPSVPPPPMAAPPPPPPPRNASRPGGSRGGSRQASRSRQPSPQPPMREPLPPIPSGAGTDGIVADGKLPTPPASAEKTPTGRKTSTGEASPIPPTPPAKDVLFRASRSTPARQGSQPSYRSSRELESDGPSRQSAAALCGVEASIPAQVATPPAATAALPVPTPPRTDTPPQLEAQYLTPRRPSADSIAQRSPPPAYEQTQTPQTRGPRPQPLQSSPTPARRALPQEQEPLPSTPPHMRSRFDSSHSPARTHGAKPSVDSTPQRLGTPPPGTQLQPAPSAYRRLTQTRPPGPVGPRPSGPRSRQASVSTGPRPQGQGHLLTASTSSVSTVAASVSASTSTTSLPTASTSRSSTTARRPSTADTRGGPRFQSEPVPIRPYTLEAAQWTFSSQELQGLVTRAIKQSAEPGSVRVLPLEVLEEQLPAELERLETRQADLRTRYRLLVRKRNALLTAAGTGAGDVQAKLEDLRAVTTTLDEISDAMYVARDQAAQLQVLAANHAGSALAIALRKINAAFLKRTKDAQDLAARCAALEQERDDAWRAAQAVAADLDQLNDTLAEGSIASIPESRQGSSERVTMSRKNSARVARAGLRSRRGSQAGPSSKRVSLAAASPSLSSQRFSMQSRSSVYSQQGPFSPDTSPPPPVPKMPRLSMHTLAAHGMSTPGGYSNASDRTPSSSATGAENTQALRDVMHMLGIEGTELPSQPRRRASMSAAPTPATPAFSFNVVGSPVLSPTAPLSASGLHRSRSVSAVDALGPSEHESERVAVLATLDSGLIET